MKRSNIILGLAGFLALSAAGVFTAPKLSAAIRGALVEIVVPSKPFFAEIVLLNSGQVSAGPQTGTLAVSSLTITNYGSDRELVTIFAPVLSGGGCGVGTILVGQNPLFSVFVGPGQTSHLTYPTPLVFGPVAGNTCIAAVGPDIPQNNAVVVDINGFVD